MKNTIILLLFTLICNSTFAQIVWTKTDTTKSIYRHLKTKKIYAVSSSSNGTEFKVEEKVVSKKTYQKYSKTWENLEKCRPCILLTYDINDKLISKGIQYGETQVGYRIEYYPNGKVKLIGHYKENSTGNWSDFFNENNYQREDGVFTYYNENGEELYSEYWKNGQFIEQVPEQGKLEIWNVELTLDNVKINNKVLPCGQINEIQISPKFKNSSNSGANLSIEFGASTTGKKPFKQSFTIEEFRKFDVCKVLEQLDIKSPNSASCVLSIFSNGEIIRDYFLTITP